MLLVGRDDMNRNRWECSTCPYQFPIDKQMTTRVKLIRKQVDDIMGGEDAWKNVDSTDTACPKCDNPRAFFMQLQIRSADEPSTYTTITKIKFFLSLFTDRIFLFPPFFLTIK